MEQSSAAFSCDQNLQRLAAKSSCAADFLKNAASVAENWQKKHKKVNHYIQQVKLIVTWRRGCGALKMVGSASKTLGGVMVVAAPLHPKLGLAVKVGHKLWKLGSGLKILTAIGSMLRDLWQVGCRNSLLEFVTVTANLTHNLGVFGEVIRDLQQCAQPLSASNNSQTSDQVLSLLRPFIPPDQLEYVRHAINIVFHNTSYSPLFDFILTSSDLTGERSNTAQLMQEIESFRFTEFLEQGSSQFLAAIGSFLHISRELLDFLDGFQKVTEQDCRFLHECLTRLGQESASIQRAATTLTNLTHFREHASTLTNLIHFGEHASTLTNLTHMGGHASTLTNLTHMGGHASTLTNLTHMGGLELSPDGTNMSSHREIDQRQQNDGSTEYMCQAATATQNIIDTQTHKQNAGDTQTQTECW